MKKRLDSPIKEQILQIALNLVDENGGASRVNLREVARTMGCSAPNIYNYFSSLDALLNTVLIRICDDFQKTIREKAAKVTGQKELILLAFQNYIEYAVNFPGRLNFFHFEKLDIAMFPETIESAKCVGNIMTNILISGTGNGACPGKTAEVSKLMHCYLLGELSEYVTGRITIADKNAYVDSLVRYSRSIFDILINNL